MTDSSDERDSVGFGSGGQCRMYSRDGWVRAAGCVGCSAETKESGRLSRMHRAEIGRMWFEI